jgi:uncharacterized protein (TIGR02594 family)
MSDEAQWASGFVNFSMQKAGIEGTRNPRALSWLTWGQPLTKPARGCIAVLDYGGGRGHVGFVDGYYRDMVVLIGGNQDGAVSRVAFASTDITAYRWPAERPIPPTAFFDLPEVQPTKAQSNDLPMHSVPSSVSDISEFQSSDGGRHLKVQQSQPDQIQFSISATGACTRNATGVAYEIYPEDMEIDSELGIGYPVREYFFWGDSQGKKGLSVRLSAKGPARARIAEWGYDAACPFSAGL